MQSVSNLIGKPRAAYIHVPFCRHRCGYCNFSVLAGHDDRAVDFLSALETELTHLRTPRTVDTLFIGGGTPTHLGRDWIDRLLTLATHWFPLSESGELTVEANPSDISSEKLQTLAEHGVNRISLGVQSFNNAKLTHLERDHTPDQARRAIELADSAIGNVSMDLIFATPNETAEQWSDDLQQAVSLPIKHLSTYGLTYEKGTLFWNRLNQQSSEARLIEIAEDDQLAMYRSAIDNATGAGFKHYEVSNFARPGYPCQHNLAYWQGVGWYAAGPGAARFVDGRREVNHRSPTTYIRRLANGRSPIAESETLSREQLLRERVAFGLRMIDGIDLASAAPIDEVQSLLGPTIENLQSIGMVERSGNRLVLTQQGLYVSDAVLSEIL